MKEINNILQILKETKRFIKEENFYELKNLSNNTIHTATISQDPDNIIVAVLIYSLAKVYGRENYKTMEGWTEIDKAITTNLNLTIQALEKEDVEKARLHLGKIRNSLNESSGDLSRYVKDVFRKAEINKAFKLYEHGISSEQTAELLGVSLWDLSSYIGQSTISESKAAISMPAKQRIKIAEDIFA